VFPYTVDESTAQVLHLVNEKISQNLHSAHFSDPDTIPCAMAQLYSSLLFSTLVNFIVNLTWRNMDCVTNLLIQYCMVVDGEGGFITG